jgi:hypothetical protein
MNAHDTLTARHEPARWVLPPIAARRPRWDWLVTRALGAVAVLIVGAIHLHEYLGPYHSVPTIGTLFLVNFVGASVVGLALLAPLEHLAGRLGGAAVALAAAGGIVLAGTSLVMLLVSERTPLFGFEEGGYAPLAIATSRDTEIAVVILLGAALVSRFAIRGPKLRW